MLTFGLIAIAIWLDTIAFMWMNPQNIRPDALIAVVVSIGVSRGIKPAVWSGLIAGFIIDVFYFGFIGQYMAIYAMCGVVSGAFYGKFYVHNVIIPALIALAYSIFKEMSLWVVARIFGVNALAIHVVFARYALGCAVLTAMLCAIIHMPIKKAYISLTKRKE